jgi:hypothetical protein
MNDKLGSFDRAYNVCFAHVHPPLCSRTPSLKLSAPSSMGYVLDRLRSPDAIISLLVLFVSYKLVKTFVTRKSNARLPKLKGPPNTSLLYGRLLEVNKSNDRGTTYAEWAGKYGDVFEIPAQLGGRHIIIFDPKAIAHFLSKDTFTYIGSNFSKAFIKRFVSSLRESVVIIEMDSCRSLDPT